MVPRSFRECMSEKLAFLNTSARLPRDVVFSNIIIFILCFVVFLFMVGRGVVSDFLILFSILYCFLYVFCSFWVELVCLCFCICLLKS